MLPWSQRRHRRTSHPHRAQSYTLYSARATATPAAVGLDNGRDSRHKEAGDYAAYTATPQGARGVKTRVPTLLGGPDLLAPIATAVQSAQQAVRSTAAGEPSLRSLHDVQDDSPPDGPLPTRTGHHPPR
jgi:hypothetical protein